MSSSKLAIVGQSGFGVTQRKDAWWVEPLISGLVFAGFIIYSSARAVMNRDYQVVSDRLLSPIYSPLLVFDGMPAWLSPAFLILWAPGGFRLTCYYYRKSYYRAFFQDPAACAVGEEHGEYRGETAFPFILQNAHRFFLYAALVFNVVLWVDAIESAFPGGKFGVTVGTVVLIANATLLMMYSLSCHSLRHLVGGKLDCFSCSAENRARHTAWRGLTKLNSNHMMWAWLSLLVVGFADFYVWMVASGQITNLRLI